MTVHLTANESAALLGVACAALCLYVFWFLWKTRPTAVTREQQEERAERVADRIARGELLDWTGRVPR